MRFCSLIMEISPIYRLFASLLMLMLMPVTAYSTRVEGLFQAEVEVASRSKADREAAVQEAMRNVLVRIIGREDALDEEAVQQLLRRAGDFTEQFAYQQQRLPDSASGERKLNFQVQFDGTALSREIRRRGLPFWGQERPDVLFWLAIDDQGQRHILAEQGDATQVDTVQQAARQRGLPLMLPLMDLDDQRAIQFTDVAGGFTPAIREASQRYRPQIILVCKLQRAPGASDWRANWTLLSPTQDRSWETRSTSVSEALEQGVGQAGEWIAQRYALVSGEEQLRSLTVEGVQDLSAYARVFDYLASLTPIEHVEVARVSDGVIEFNLQLVTDEESLSRLITLGRVLKPGDSQLPWHFNYRP